MALCEIPFNLVKSSMGKKAVMHLTNFLLNQCRGKKEILSESLNMVNFLVPLIFTIIMPNKNNMFLKVK